MAETKINLNYQVDETQFDNKVGTAVETGGASDEVEASIDARFNEGGPTGGHTHSGTILDGQKVTYANLDSIPGTFAPSAHNHPFTEVTGDIVYTQLDSIISAAAEASKIIQANDARLSDSRDPNAHNHPFTDITGDIVYTQLDNIISAGADASKIIQANDARLSDARTPTSHNNTYHSATYITSAGVTYDNLSNNGDIGVLSNQVAQGDHTHDDRYYAQGTVDTLLGGKANTVHAHTDGEVQEAGLADDASFKNVQSRPYSFSPFGIGDWQINENGAAYTNPTGGDFGTGQYVVGLQLPHDAMITELEIALYSEGVHDLLIKLMATDMVSGLGSEMAQITHTTSTTDFDTINTTDFATGSDLIDRSLYHYWLLIEESSTHDVDLIIAGIIATCDVTIPLP